MRLIINYFFRNQMLILTYYVADYLNNLGTIATKEKSLYTFLYKLIAVLLNVYLRNMFSNFVVKEFFKQVEPFLRVIILPRIKNALKIFN